MQAIDLFKELLLTKTLNEIAELLNLHIGTLRRWKENDSVPKNYFNDLNSLLEYKYENKEEFRDKDQFYTTKKTAEYCYKKTLEILKELEINVNEYTFIEPSAGCCNFYCLLPADKRIGVDINDFGNLALKSKNPVKIAARCTVFAESDLIHKIQAGYRKEDIIAGVCRAVAVNYINNVAKGTLIYKIYKGITVLWLVKQEKRANLVSTWSISKRYVM